MIDNYINNLSVMKLKDTIMKYINNITVVQLLVLYFIYLLFGSLIQGLLKAALYTVVVTASVIYVYKYLEKNQ